MSETDLHNIYDTSFYALSITVLCLCYCVTLLLTLRNDETRDPICCSPEETMALIAVDDASLLTQSSQRLPPSVVLRTKASAKPRLAILRGLR
jgi:hypothetical protein